MKGGTGKSIKHVLHPGSMVVDANPVGTRRRGAQQARWLDQMEQYLGVQGAYEIGEEQP